VVYCSADKALLGLFINSSSDPFDCVLVLQWSLSQRLLLVAAELGVSNNYVCIW
jgi:hypothetical protein